MNRRGYQIFDEVGALLTKFFFNDRRSAIEYAEGVLQVMAEETLTIRLMDIPEDY